MVFKFSNLIRIKSKTFCDVAQKKQAAERCPPAISSSKSKVNIKRYKGKQYNIIYSGLENQITDLQPHKL